MKARHNDSKAHTSRGRSTPRSKIILATLPLLLLFLILFSGQVPKKQYRNNKEGEAEDQHQADDDFKQAVQIEEYYRH